MPIPHSTSSTAARLCAALALCWASHAAAADNTITVTWLDKAPYHYMENGEGKGFLLSRVQEIFAAAKIPARFVMEPQKRIWSNFSRGTRNYCSFSWYRLAEREPLAQFTAPIYTDPAQSVAVAPAALARLRSHPTMAAALADPQLTLGIIDGVSYGAELDAMIARTQSQVMRRTVNTATLARMLALGRVSFIIIDRYDWEYFRQTDKLLQDVVRHDFPDIPAGLKRHIACSRDIAPELIERLNQAIAASGGGRQSTEEKRPARGHF